ncbi:Type-1 restriction enzyme EcoKI specificity protein [Streptomyces sp. S4.7]|uniref:restriction endonuclease subunit S n=1 Tax=Streptomyces sp. S4.7 TaxID=2705439 RepID=UPI0013972D74|nr:restriction endonuclease subunit S [Streptomyces sp. S4.7]QHY97654.1 Type-1 restriction enzyme EcoKI specificity protein [Streptomyces sp. S4.7]
MSGEEQVGRRKLSDLAAVAGGVTLGREVPESASVELPYLRVANVQDGYIDTGDVKTVRVLESEVERFSLRKGDVLLTEGGDFDKLGRGAVWDGRLDPCLYQNHIFRVRCNLSDLLPEYLSLFLASPEGRTYFLSIAKQTTNLATINSSQLKAMPVPLPSTNEQRRIVDVLDSLTREQDALSASIAKLSLIEDGMKRSLLSQISVGNRSSTIGDLGTVVTGMTPPAEWNNMDGRGGIPMITPSQVSSDGEVSGFSRLISSEYFKNLREVRRGATLAVCIGFGVGKVGYVKFDCCTNQQINSVIPSPDVDSRYAYLAVEESMRIARGRVNLQVTPIINKAEFSSLEVTIPDMAYQRRVADSIWAVRGSQERLMLEFTKLRHLKAGMMNDLLPAPVR